MDVEPNHGITVVEIVFEGPSDGEGALVTKIDDYTDLAIGLTQRESQGRWLDHYCCCRTYL